MSEQNAAPLLVVSHTQEPVDKINSIMCRDGQEVRCAWVAGPREVTDMIMEVAPHLLIHVGGARDQLEALNELRNRVAPTLALVVVSESALDEAAIADLLSHGVHDAVSFAHPDRMRAVILRELRSYAAHHPQAAAREPTPNPPPTPSPPATPPPPPSPDPPPPQDTAAAEAAPSKPSGRICAHVQEGILVEASRRWLNLLGLDESVVGEPVMDLFTVSSQGALRAALSGTHQGRWREEPLELEARGGDGSPVRLHLKLLPGEHDGEPCVRLVAPSEEGEEDPAAEAEVVDSDCAALDGDVRMPAAAVDTAAVEGASAAEPTQTPTPEPPPPAEHQAPAAAAPAAQPEPDVQAAPAPRPQENPTPRESTATASMDDRAWIKLLRSALIENRFRLVQHPISSLHGEDPSMFEVLLRLLDPVGREILPEQFAGPAERHDMLKNIDRWVVGASLSFVAQRAPRCLFVHLSGDTARDEGFISWIDNQLRVGRAQPERLCLQVPEAVASENLREVREMSEALRERGFRFALEAFGTHAQSVELLEHVPVDFVKIDSTLMESVAHNPQTLQQVRKLVDAAGQRFILTIGENVQDADTMAVLWEVGMQYVQANFSEQPLQRAGR